MSSAAAAFGRAAWRAGEAVSASSDSPFDIDRGGVPHAPARPPETSSRHPSYVTNAVRVSASISEARSAPYDRAEAMAAFFDTSDAPLSGLTRRRRMLAAMHPGFCPQCGERVTPYAAGCALCGADLDPKRWQKPVSARQRLSVRMPAGLRRAIRGRDAVRVRGSL
jgi:hypothetical protein